MGFRAFFLLTFLSLASAGWAQRFKSVYMVTTYTISPDGQTVNMNDPFVVAPGTYFDFVSEERSFVLTDSISPAYPKGSTLKYRAIYVLPFDESRGDVSEARLNNEKLQSVKVAATVDTNEDGLIDERDQVIKRCFFALPTSSFVDDGFIEVHRVGGWPTPKLGTVAFPVKVRLGSPRDNTTLIGDSVVTTSSRPPLFSTDLTLGTSLGLSWRLSRIQERYLTLLMSAGVTSITLDSASIPGKYSADVTKTAAFSGAIGIMYEFGQGGQIGMVIGLDMIGGETGRYWRYEKKPWLGLGIGVQIFSETVGDDKDLEKKLQNVADNESDVSAPKKAKKKKAAEGN